MGVGLNSFNLHMADYGPFILDYHCKYIENNCVLEFIIDLITVLDET